MVKEKTTFIVDALTLLSFVVTGVTGLFIKFFLPSQVKGGGLATFLGITKITWKAVHNWAGAIMIVLVLVHVVLHWNQFVGIAKAAFRKE